MLPCTCFPDAAATLSRQAGLVTRAGLGPHFLSLRLPCHDLVSSCQLARKAAAAWAPALLLCSPSRDPGPSLALGLTWCSGQATSRAMQNSLGTKPTLKATVLPAGASMAGVHRDVEEVGEILVRRRVEQRGKGQRFWDGSIPGFHIYKPVAIT